MDSEDINMNLSDINDIPIPQPTDEMVRYFEKRTREHINRVANNLKKLYKITEWGSELLERARIHDDSKYLTDFLGIAM